LIFLDVPGRSIYVINDWPVFYFADRLAGDDGVGQYIADTNCGTLAAFFPGDAA